MTSRCRSRPKRRKADRGPDRPANAHESEAEQTLQPLTNAGIGVVGVECVAEPDDRDRTPPSMPGRVAALASRLSPTGTRPGSARYGRSECLRRSFMNMIS